MVFFFFNQDSQRLDASIPATAYAALSAHLDVIGKLLSFASWAMAVRHSRTWPMCYAAIGNSSGRLSQCLILVVLLPGEKNGMDV